MRSFPVLQWLRVAGFPDRVPDILLSGRYPGQSGRTVHAVFVSAMRGVR